MSTSKPHEQTCRICDHPQRAEIEHALVIEGRAPSTVGRDFHINWRRIEDHCAHLPDIQLHHERRQQLHEEQVDQSVPDVDMPAVPPPAELVDLPERRRVAVLLRQVADHLDVASVTTVAGTAVRLGARMLDEADELLTDRPDPPPPIPEDEIEPTVIRTLRGLGTSDVRTIADRTHLAPRTVSQVLSDLKQRGLATMHRRDQRTWSLTEDGELELAFTPATDSSKSWVPT